jgi:hypothetical protein
MERGKRIVLPGLIVAVMTLFSACALTPSAPVSAIEKQNTDETEQQARVPNEYLVTLAPHVEEAIIYEYYKRFGIKYVHELADETYLLILSNDPGPHEMKVLIQDESRIKIIQPNLIHWDYR